MLRLYVWYAFAGFLALGYQVVWFRSFVDAFGSTNLTFAFVLCSFIGGLGAGSLASRALAARLRTWRFGVDPLRCYGWIEIGVGLTAATGLWLPWLASGWSGPFPYAVDAVGVYQPTPMASVLQLAICVGCVFVPSFLMGVTFPLLCGAFVRQGQLPAALYAWNTAGAAAGLLLCEFVLLPRLGHGNLHIGLVLGNLAFGVWFAAGRGPAVAGEPGRSIAERQPAAAPPAHPDGVLWAIAVQSGFLTGAFEADVLRRVQFLDCRTGAALTCISFWAIVAIFAGSSFVRAAPWLRLRHLQVATLCAGSIYAALWYFAYPLRDWAVDADRQVAIASQPRLPPDLVGSFQFFPFAYGSSAVLWFTGLWVLPAFFLLSLALPLACNAAQAGGRHLGRLYGANTLAFCIGLLLFSVAAPRVNLFFAMRLFLVVFAIVAAFLLWLRPAERRTVTKAGVALVAGVVAAFVTPAGFAPGWFPTGDPAAVLPVRAMRSDGAHTTYVVADPAGDVLYFDSHPMSGCNPTAQQYMRLMAHWPLLAHDEPRSALLICFGVGSTASAITAHPTIQQVDIVDLNDQVFATAPEFAAVNRNVIADRRVRLIHDDGRRFLAGTDQRYDLITSEPPPPMFAGVARLYSIEYYRAARSHLRPGGFMTQWLPVDQMPQRVVAAAIRSFVEVFPDALLLVGAGTNYVLVGCDRAMSLANLEARFPAESAVLTDLRASGIRRPLDLCARLVRSPAQLQSDGAAAETISDQHNLLSLAFHDPRSAPVVSFDPVGMLADFDRRGARSLACRAEWERAALDLGRLKSLVPDFPESTLKSVRNVAGATVVAGTDTDWHVVAARFVAADRALAMGQAEVAVAQLEKAAAAAPGYLEATRRLGTVLLQVRRLEPALRVWQQVQAADPGDPTGGWGMAAVLLLSGEAGRALVAVEGELRRFPAEPALHRLRGDILAALSRPADAVHAYDRALQLQPNDEATKRARDRLAQPQGR